VGTASRIGPNVVAYRREPGGDGEASAPLESLAERVASAIPVNTLAAQFLRGVPSI